MTRRKFVSMAVCVGLWAGVASAVAAAPVSKLRPVRLVQDASELGLTAGIVPGADGSVVVTATAGPLTVRKSVYPDGRFAVRLSQGADDRLVIAGDLNGLRVAYGKEPGVDLRPDRDADYEQHARRVRGWLASSEAVQRFRQIVGALDRQEAQGPEALSLRVTGALVAELLGDPGAAQRLSRSLGSKLSRRLRPAQSGGTGYGWTCYDIYERMVVNAANTLESCIASFAVYNPLRQVCAGVWVLQVESAWFQFLACSSFPVR
jgi:hypothetical protein